jgi:glutaminyl-peptide cyclotransferase
LLTNKFSCLIKISTTLNQQQANEIAKWDNQSHYMNAQKNILIPRVVGSKGWLQVQNFIVNELESMGVEVEFDSFEDNVPIFGRLNFVNIIGRVNPKADKFLVLSAHYDSKYFQDHDFLGATGEKNTKKKSFYDCFFFIIKLSTLDSAVPCAMILNLLKTTLPTLNPMLKDKNLGLMVIFFDGEEAFVEWNEQDSIYGSRHLAKKWANENYKNGKEIDRIVMSFFFTSKIF